MKKIFSKILIAILILGFFFAPVTPKIDTQNHFSLVKNETRAQIVWAYSTNTNGYKVRSFDTEDACKTARQAETDPTASECIKVDAASSPSDKSTYWIFSVTIGISAGKVIKSDSEIACNIKRVAYLGGGNPTPCLETLEFTDTEIKTEIEKAEAKDFDHGCGIRPWTWHRCIVAWIYYLIFMPSAWLARICAAILDYFSFYSLDSDSYRNPFIDTGWTVIRDIANLFFIIALLYVAGKTVLGLNSSNNKKVISMVIVMALIINFSLFITKVVIDASNILARVFYANIENVGPNGEANIVGSIGEKSISIGLVKQFNPQKIFTDSQLSADDNFGTYTVLLFLSIIMMFYMIYVFLTLSFVFIGRVVMLWILMIFSPIAFASYTMPTVNIPGFGHKEWWKQLLDQAFLAPIFIFFLYLIISFADIFKIFTETSNPDGLIQVNTLSTYLNVIIPFIILMALLSKAKDVTLKMSGELGSRLSAMGTVVGGAVLGTSLAGVALLGRQTLGATAKYASDDDKRDKDRKVTSRFKDQWAKGGLARLNLLEYGKILRTGAQAGTAEFLTGSKRASDGTVVQRNKFGNFVMKSKEDFKEKKESSEIVTNKIAKMAADLHVDKDTKFGDLSKPQQQKVKDEINLDLVSKAIYDGRSFDKLSAAEKKSIRTATITENSDGSINYSGTNSNTGLSKSGSNVKGAGEITKTAMQGTTINTIAGEAITSAGKGGWDPRNISKLSSKEMKTMVGLLAGIAYTLRGGFKQISQIDPGTGNKDFMTDLKNTIDTSIKGIGKTIKLEAGLKKSGGGDHGGHDDHGGGHDDHGGGGHH